MTSTNQINGGDVLIDKFLSKSQLQEVVTKTVGNSEFSIEDVRIRPASEVPLGFCGDHMRLAIDVNVAGTIKNFKYFVKTTPKDNEQKSNFVEKYDLASTEGRAFKLIEEIKNFTGDEPFCAGCYYASESLLVFDDLALEGFESNDARKPFLKEHCITTLTSLANFHASSFIYEEQQSKKIGRKFRFSEVFKDIFNRGIFDMTSVYEVGLHTTLKIAELFSKHAKDANKLRLIRQKWYSLWECNLELADPSPLCRNSLVHRDLWARNLLYKYEDGVPTQCRLADFQTVGCLPPAADVHSAIYLNTSAAQRKESYTEFIDHYYRKLTENLKRYNLDVDDFAPREEFLKWCQKYKMWGNINGIAWHPIFVKEEYISEVQKHSEVFDNFFNTVPGRLAVIEKAIRNDELYKKIVMEYIDEFIESYILNE